MEGKAWLNTKKKPRDQNMGQKHTQTLRDDLNIDAQSVILLRVAEVVMISVVMNVLGHPTLRPEEDGLHGRRKQGFLLPKERLEI